RSRVRARVEHVFGHQQNSMGGKIVRTIGIARARFKIGMMNLGYNIRRLVQLERLAAVPAWVLSRGGAVRPPGTERVVASQASKRPPIGGSPGHEPCTRSLSEGRIAKTSYCSRCLRVNCSARRISRSGIG